jgi:ferrochelatase
VSREAPTAVLCMAYGSPGSESEIEAYYTHIRGGRRPSPEALDELKHRYRAIGGSPLTSITKAQAAALGEALGLPAFAGMKHAPPFIAEAAAEARRAGIRRLVGLPLAPHFAAMSLGAYERELTKAWDGELIFIRGFHDHPAFIQAVAGLLGERLAESRPERLFFTAHSLPARIVAEGDGYQDRLLESCRLVAAARDLPPWEFAFQCVVQRPARVHRCAGGGRAGRAGGPRGGEPAPLAAVGGRLHGVVRAADDHLHALDRIVLDAFQVPALGARLHSAGRVGRTHAELVVARLVRLPGVLRPSRPRMRRERIPEHGLRPGAAAIVAELDLRHAPAA